MKKIVLLICCTFIFQNSINAQYVYGPDDMGSEISTVQPPIENAALSFSDYSIDSKTTTTLQHNTGTKIIIPSNAFVDKKGNLVEGKVDIKFREFTNPLDIFLSGIPMIIEQGNKKEFFQSAGMVEIQVSQNGEEVFPNPNGEMVMIEMTSSQLEDNFQLYNLDEATGEWIEEGKDEVLWNSNELDASLNNNTTTNGNSQPKFNFSTPPPREPTIQLSGISVDKLHRRKEPYHVPYYSNLLQFQIEIHGDNLRTYKENKVDSFEYINHFLNLKKIKGPFGFMMVKTKRKQVSFYQRSEININFLLEITIKIRYQNTL